MPNGSVRGSETRLQPPADTDLPATAPAGRKSQSIIEIENRQRSFIVRNRRPRITAVEIENFKGIARNVRIELKPITLLFGGNSAGKSTILHALCYAHEILRCENVDAHEISAGGHTVDLGGFENIVHAHDLRRTIKLRFELDLRGWRGPSRQLLRQYREFPDFSDVQSGWVTLETSYDEDLRRPKLDAYEVGVNGQLIGRLETTVRSEVRPAHTGVELLANLAHPLLNCGDTKGVPAAPRGAARVREARESGLDGRQYTRWTALYRSSPMPSWAWDEPIFIKAAHRSEVSSHTTSDETQALLSGLLVGVGKWLRDELNGMRHVGPVRDVEGTDVWNTLLNWEASDTDRVPERYPLVEEVSGWLERKDRLDTGYALRMQPVVELRGEPVLVPLMRQYHGLRTEFGNADGIVDVDALARKMAAYVIENRDPVPDGIPETVEEVERRIKSGDEKIGVSVGGRQYPDLAALVAKIEERRFTVAELNELSAAVSAARTRQELQLFDNKKRVLVRIQDVGVGISQVLPVLVAALDPNRPGITAIEQPELHVHPRIQVELGDLFAAALVHPVDRSPRPESAAEQPIRPDIFLIETHSEHLLLRIMRRMRQTCDGTLPDDAPRLRPEDVAVFYVEPDGAETLVREMPLNERGELVEAWPGGFFEEDLREIFDVRETS